MVALVVDLGPREMMIVVMSGPQTRSTTMLVQAYSDRVAVGPLGSEMGWIVSPLTVQSVFERLQGRPAPAFGPGFR